MAIESVHADAGFWRNLGSLVEVMMWANNCGRDGFAGQGSVYGKCREAIVDMLHAKYPQLTKQQLRNGHGRYGWNEGGNATYLDDVRVMVEALLDEEGERVFVADVTEPRHVDAMTKISRKHYRHFNCGVEDGSGMLGIDANVTPSTIDKNPREWKWAVAITARGERAEWSQDDLLEEAIGLLVEGGEDAGE